MNPTTTSSDLATRVCVTCLIPTDGAAYCPRCHEADRAQEVYELDGRVLTKGELADAFDVVADPEDWRAPIRATIASAAFELTAAAVLFYTCTSLYVAGGTGDEMQVEAAGYRAGPAA